jgi:hypothetical protein
MPLFRRLVALLFLLTQVVPSRATGGVLAPAWPEPTQLHRPWTRWWWLGSAVDRANLTRELEAFSAAGFGGVEITPIYGAKGYEDRFVAFLSPRYLELLAHTGTEARRLGLGVDMATGTGWPFGGPQVGAADAELKVAFAADGTVSPRPTDFKVKRSAPGGEGLVLNPYSTTALAHYLAPFTRALATLPPGTIQGQFHDSFEYQANWAREVPEKFLALHGYDVRDHAAELAGHGDPDTVARIKADYRTTLGALHLEYVRAWVAWAHGQGQTARNQAHGAPGNLLDLYAAADIPETEIFGSLPFPIPGFRREAAEIDRPGHPPVIHRFASSAAHVMGHPLVSAETFTWLREHFHEAPSEMKPELDALFLAGINHVYYHGAAYSPADAPWPGWLFYASSQLNTRNPLWRDLGDGPNAYITRVQSLLQAGRPDNELLVYWPADDLWHDPEGLQLQLTVHADWLEKSATGPLMNELLAKGYSFDLISDLQLAQTEAGTNGAIRAPGGNYAAILVPRTAHMEPATLRHLLKLGRQGATVMFIDALPSDVPGFGRLEERRGQLQGELARSDPSQVRLGPLAELLHATLGAGEPMVEAGLQFIRRSTDLGEIYFVANQGEKPVDGWIALGAPAHTVTILDPLTGKAGLAQVRQVTGDKFVTQVYLQLAPGESCLLETLRLAAMPKTTASWPYVRASAAPVALDGDWQVTALRGGPELPPAFRQHGFGSWTAQGGEWERFGGTARYEAEFTLPAGATADDWLLDLGDVRETARVFINGRDAGLLWALPMRMRIGSFLQPGKNTLALEVTNLAANRIRDLDRRQVPWKKFHEINFVNIHYQPFDASSWPPAPSGLLGPVTLTPLRGLDLQAVP